jgi:hypothetical protein
MGQVIAIIDSGFDSKSLLKVTINQVDFVNINHQDFIDRIGHGTAVGKIANVCAPGAQLVNLKVTNDKNVSEANIIKALEMGILFR